MTKLNLIVRAARTSLEALDLSHNCVERVCSVDRLSAILQVNLGVYIFFGFADHLSYRLDYNCLREFQPSATMASLRVLRLSHNRLQTFDADSFPELRTLWLDENHLRGIRHARRMSKLENMSIREQRLSSDARW